MLADRLSPTRTSPPIPAQTLPGPSAFAAFRYLQSGNFRGGPEWMLDCARRYGPLARVRLFGKEIFLVADHELARQILLDTKAFAKSRGSERLKVLLGEGLLTSSEPFHLRQRRLAQPAFHRDRIAGYGTTMIALAAQWSSRREAGATIDVAAEMMSVTMAIAAQTLFVTDMSASAQAIADSLAVLMRLFPVTMMPLGEQIERLPLPPMREYRAARRTLDRVIYELVAERRADTVDRGDLLSMLMLAVDDDGSRMSDRQVRDEALTLFIAGHETTAIALTWAWYVLARNPEARRNLLAELDRVLGDRDPVPEDYPKLVYTYAVFKEVLRLYPPAYRIGRRAVADTVVGDYRFPAGASIFVSPFVTQRDPALYPAPERFVPERWLGEVTTPKSAFFPFGGGNRLCIGDSFAWMEGVLAIATIARRWSLETVDAEPVGFNPSVTLRPDGPVRMRVVPRA